MPTTIVLWPRLQLRAPATGDMRRAQVPANMTAVAGSANQLFADLPGGSKMPMTGLGMCCRGTAYHNESVRRSVLW